MKINLREILSITSEFDMFHVKQTNCYLCRMNCFGKGMTLLKQERINCMTCKYYYVTWDPNFPKGCKAFGFKTRNLPSIEVKKASGEDCLKYEKK